MQTSPGVSEFASRNAQLLEDFSSAPCISAALHLQLQDRVSGGEAAYELDVHLPLFLPQSNVHTLTYTLTHSEPAYLISDQKK